MKLYQYELNYLKYFCVVHRSYLVKNYPNPQPNVKRVIDDLESLHAKLSNWYNQNMIENSLKRSKNNEKQKV